MKIAIQTLGVLLLLSCATLADGGKPDKHPGRPDITKGRSAAGSVAAGAGKAAVVIVSSAAKVGWETTKFAAGRVALPAGKVILLKAAPKTSIFVLKHSGVAAKRLMPLALKLSLL